MKGSDPPWGSPPNAYELLKVEIEFFVQNYFDNNGLLPTNDAMQLEACRIIFAAESVQTTYPSDIEAIQSVSWLRDLIMSSPELTRQARFGPIRTSSESRHTQIKINGKDHMFEKCPLEAQLQAFITGQQLVDEVPDDAQLTKEACDIVRRMEATSHRPSDIFANWLVKGIWSGTDWLSNFKKRAGICEANNGINIAEMLPTMQGWDMQWPPDLLFPLAASNAVATTEPLNKGDYTQDTSFSTALEELTLTSPMTSSAHAHRSTFLPDDTNFFRCFEKDVKRWVAATMVRHIIFIQILHEGT